MQGFHLLIVTEKRVLFLSNLDRAAAELRNQNLVARRNAHGDSLALLVETTGSNSEDLSLVELLDGALGQEDARGGLGVGLDALDENAVEERGESLDAAEGLGAERVSYFLLKAWNGMYPMSQLQCD